MPVAPLFNAQGEKIGDVQLDASVFGIAPNSGAMHAAVVMHLARRRRGTHDTKTIGEVSGGGAKPWRQKGTGRARHGSRRSPLWRGGATLFGPTPKDYGYSIPKREQRLAVKSALSAKVASDRVLVVDGLPQAPEKTRDMAGLLQSLKLAGRKTLIVTGSPAPALERTTRNIEGVRTTVADYINAYQVLDCDSLVFTRDGLARVEEVLVS